MIHGNQQGAVAAKSCCRMELGLSETFPHSCGHCSLPDGQTTGRSSVMSKMISSHDRLRPERGQERGQWQWCWHRPADGNCWGLILYKSPLNCSLSHFPEKWAESTNCHPRGLSCIWGPLTISRGVCDMRGASALQDAPDSETGAPVTSTSLDKCWCEIT